MYAVLQNIMLLKSLVTSSDKLVIFGARVEPTKMSPDGNYIFLCNTTTKNC